MVADLNNLASSTQSAPTCEAQFTITALLGKYFLKTAFKNFPLFTFGMAKFSNNIQLLIIFTFFDTGH